MIGTTIVITGSLFTVAALGAAIYINAGPSSFLYANSRIIARTSQILDKTKLAALAALNSLPDLINNLKDTEYYPYLESIDKSNMREFNMALEEGFIESLKQIESISPKKFKPIFKIYSKFYEAKIIKTFFRSRFSHIKIDRRLIEPMGSINPDLLEHLHDTKTIADMKLVLRNTDYNELFEKEFDSIETFDLAMEKKLMADIEKVLDNSKFHQKDMISLVFRKRIEIKKILTLLKLKIRNTDKDFQAEFIKLINYDEEKLINSPDIRSFVNGFAGTEYESALKKGLIEFENSDNYFDFEKELWRYYIEFVSSNDLSNTIGPYPIISYISKKEIEQKNLLIISKGIISENKEIEAMII